MVANYRTLQEIAYDSLREAILSGRYLPGHRLAPSVVAKELGVSRMPVREALRRLEAEGLVTMAPHHGAQVSQLSHDEVIEIYRIRAVLDGLATRLAAPHLTPADFDRLKAALDEMVEAAAHLDLEKATRANREFHATIWEAAHAPRLCELLESLYNSSSRYRAMSIPLPGRLEQMIHEHRGILQALMAGETPFAEALTIDHLEGTAKRLLAAAEADAMQDSPSAEWAGDA